ncbi:MAG: helix-turn-helix domain-containing protein [Lachnospiraceae bacterium]|nr:helix-turn-helix domain-containing protein [Lachnospiraceae bacterium]
MKELEISEKYLLTVKEASVYFNIGVKRIRRLAEENVGIFAVYCGNRYMIIREKFEEYLTENPSI